MSPLVADRDASLVRKFRVPRGKEIIIAQGMFVDSESLVVQKLNTPNV